MPINNSVKARKNLASTLNNIRLHRSKSQTTVPMLTEKVAPAGIYTSRITAVTMSQTQQGDEAVDVTYELADANGRITQGRLRYAVGGYHFDRLADALVDAGVPNGSAISAAVGVTEEIEIVYPQKGALAKIKTRRPLSIAKTQQSRDVEAATEDDDEDFTEDDDILVDEDDDF